MEYVDLWGGYKNIIYRWIAYWTPRPKLGCPYFCQLGTGLLGSLGLPTIKKGEECIKGFTLARDVAPCISSGVRF